jgi:hypothetical protein
MDGGPCGDGGACVTANEAALEIIASSGREGVSSWDISCFVLTFNLRPFVRQGLIERTPDGQRWRMVTA